jgi:hypothetical protein
MGTTRPPRPYVRPREVRVPTAARISPLRWPEHHGRTGVLARCEYSGLSTMSPSADLDAVSGAVSGRATWSAQLIRAALAKEL